MSEDSRQDGALRAKLLETVNRSGYPFQLRVAEEIQAPRNDRPSTWRIVAPEHRWRHEGGSGYADMVLECSRCPFLRVVIECKRQDPDSVWVFLPSGLRRRPTRLLVACRGFAALANSRQWVDSEVLDSLPEAMFCAMARKGGEKIEDFCNELLMAAECIARDDALQAPREAAAGVQRYWYFPLLITTASLYHARLATASTVSLDTGLASNEIEFTEATGPIRLTKNLWSGLPPADSPLLTLNRFADRTVFIATARRAADFLSEVETLYPPLIYPD